MATRAKAKQRSPLMESAAEEALRRRGAELVGLALMAVAALAPRLLAGQVRGRVRVAL